MEAATEASVIERCRKQDVEAFGRFLDMYQSRVFGFVRRMVANPEEAADITQEVFIRAFQNFDRFDGRSSIRTWLFRIAHNLCVDRARRLSRRVSEVSLAPADDDIEEYDVADDRWRPDEILMTDELVEVIDRGIASMSEKLRSVLILHDREEMAYEEIAAALELPLGTVKSRLFLARAHLQNVLRQYFESESAI